MATPLWKLKSGDFAGWRRGDSLYDSDGEHIGFFRGDIAYDLRGRHLGEIYRDDWIGKKQGVSRGLAGARGKRAGTALAKYANRIGLAVAGWSDPDF